MSELRDRIAAAIRTADVMPSTDTDPYIEMADAVLAALDLGNPCAATGCRMRQIARRIAETSSRLEKENQ